MPSVSGADRRAENRRGDWSGAGIGPRRRLSPQSRSDSGLGRLEAVVLCWKCDTGAPQGTTSFGVKFSRRRLRNGVDGRLSTGHPQAHRRVSRKNGTGVPTAHGRTLWAILPLVAEKGTRNPQPVDYMWKTPTVGGMHEANSGSGGGQGAVPQRPHKTAGPFRQTLREARRVRQAAIAAEAEAERQRARTWAAAPPQPCQGPEGEDARRRPSARRRRDPPSRRPRPGFLQLT